MKRRSAAVLIGLVLAVSLSAAARAEEEFRYIAPVDLKEKIETGVPMTILDIQVKEEFDSRHIRGAMPTYAYPVKSGPDREKLDAVMADITAGDAPVIIVCPRGGAGAQRTYKHLLSRGIPAGRILILRGGQSGWPYGELLE